MSAGIEKQVEELSASEFAGLRAWVHFKRIGAVWSVRVGGHYRALGHDVEDGAQAATLITASSPADHRPRGHPGKKALVTRI